MIHRDAAHPAPQRVRGRKGALLENGGRAAEAAHFIPAHADARIRQHAVIHQERFVIAEVAIGESEHEAVAKHIQSVRAPFLRNASALTFNALCGNPRGDGQS